MTLRRVRADGFELDSDPVRLDLDRVAGWLATDSYWARGRDRATVQRSFEASTGYGVYHPADGRQVAVARAVTDWATFAWLADVFVDPQVRGDGLGTWMVGEIRDHLQAAGVYRLLLATRDAHGVYARVGFGALREPQIWMELDARSTAP